MIKVLIGDILKSKMSVLVNTVNCVGVMGKGIALNFKKAFPDMFLEYSEMCENNIIKPGHIYPYYVDGKVSILNFSTKDHWRNPSKISYVKNGLEQFVNEYKSLGIESIAFPPLGCGNGGLHWDYVGPLMYSYLSKLDIDVEIYASHAIPQVQLTESFLNKKILTYSMIENKKLKINKNWFLALHMVYLLDNSKYNVVVGRTIFQKIFYIMQVLGIDMGLSFVKGTYGPYSEKITDIITYFSNNNYLVEESFGKMIRIRITDKYRFSESEYNKNTIDIFYRALDLLSRLKNTEQAELLTSIIYSYYDLLKTKSIIYEEEVITYLLEWKKKYNTKDYKVRINEICNFLSINNVIKLAY